MSDKYLVCIGGLIVIVYITYITAHVIAHSLIPDGILLSGVIAAIAYIGGVKVGKAAEQTKALSAIAEENATLEYLEPNTKA